MSLEPLQAGTTAELICVRVDHDRVHARVRPGGDPVIVRIGLSDILPVPAEIFVLEVERGWVFGHTRYALGQITASRMDAAQLGLVPLGLTEYGLREPVPEEWRDEWEKEALHE